MSGQDAQSYTGGSAALRLGDRVNYSAYLTQYPHNSDHSSCSTSTAA